MLALPRVSIDRLTVHPFRDLMEEAVMQTSGSAARRAVEALGTRGKTTRIPDEVRGVVLAYALAARAAGQSWTQQWVGSRAGAVVRKVSALSVSRVSPFVPV